jgi:bifunctional non-homologous end joining protein LigD
MLEQYRKKRDFTKTPEPAGTKAKENNTKKRAEVRFVVQKHDATNLHYDFRLETEDVLKSWAVPKGISLDPKVKRLAVLTEDHPLDYLLFEGTIPKGSYGGGTVIVWDTGSYTSEQQISHQFTKGKITFTLFGQKLKGRFSLVKTQRENQWLLIKGEDEFKSAEDMTITRPESVLTGRTNQDLESDKEDKANSNKNKIPVTESKKQRHP